MASTKTNLVIVESPAKAKTIGKYLGSGYKVEASMGHLRDLPKSVLGVDIENNFLPDYRPVKGREATIEELKKAAKRSACVYLATDPDREGEAISWHLKELLNIPDQAVCRVTFNEITKKVVQESIANPRTIDMDLVDAQQARRVLDRIVGYKLSPLLWKKIRRGLSAGRVQSVACRLVVDRENAIRSFVPEEYWYLDAQLAGESGGSFTAHYYGYAGKKQELKTEAEVQQVCDAVSQAPFRVTEVKKSERKRNPPPPFITSSLQQEASRKLGMTPRRTMSVAQQLYEGIDIPGEGTVGLITYMRTDSLRLSDVALADAAVFIKDHYGPDHYAGSPRQFKTKNTAQDAHEAIRPSNVFLTPDSIRPALNTDQYKLYRLIWSRFVACQMAAAVFDNVTVDAESAGHTFRASHSVQKFAGYSAVYEEGKDEEKEEKSSALPKLEAGMALSLQQLNREQKFTQPPSRYTEATLIREMEETGIGRPSTYAPTISTIMDREYVVKEGKNLRPTPLGEVVTGLMVERFGDIVDLKFTAHMEDSLDDVEKGSRVWTDVLADFYKKFEQELKDAESALEGERIKVPDEVSDEICDICGRNLVVKSGRFGRFLACPGYPECSFTKPLVVEMPGKCPKCGSRILKRTSKNGYTYYACEHLTKACDFLTWDVPVKDNCPECGMTMFKKSGRGYKKPFCINETCSNFTPEDKRGGYKKKVTEGEQTPAPASAEAPAEEKTQEKKPAGKKPAAKKAGTKKAPAKKPAAKKPGTRKTKKAGEANEG